MNNILINGERYLIKIKDGDGFYLEFGEYVSNGNYFQPNSPSIYMKDVIWYKKESEILTDIEKSVISVIVC